MALKDVCRLCLAKDNLVWVFDKSAETKNNLKDVVLVTTGVEISKNDIVSQKICAKCCHITIKMFEFRKTSMKNDSYLKEECSAYLKNNNVKIPNTNITIRNEGKIVKPEQSVNKAEQKQERDNKSYKVHPSVRALFKTYPQIKLPTTCVKSNIDPVVCLEMDGVENYFRSRQLDFNYYTKLALRSDKKVATKRTSAPAKPKHPRVQSDNSEIKPVKAVIRKSENQPIKITFKFNIKNNESELKSESADSRIKQKNDLVPEKISSDKKRKLPKTDDVHNENCKKPALFESLGLTPKYGPSSHVESPAVVANVSVPLHICEICNSVQYSAKDLKKHQHKHLVCQFCKAKFRTMEIKNEHVYAHCVVKKTLMNALPDVVLEKIERNRGVREKYPTAFTDFPAFGRSDSSTKTCDPLEEATAESTTSASASQKIMSNINENRTEVIEILDDEDSEPLPTTSANVARDSILQKTLLGTIPSEQNRTKETNIPIPISNSNTPLRENIVYNTVAVVKPDIRIKGNTVLDNIDTKMSDVKLLKELLINYRALNVYEERYTQTDLPKDDSISIVNRTDATTELKNLRQQMYMYKIPVVIKYGPFKVCYNYDLEPRPPRKMCLWNDLTPIDIKVNTGYPSTIQYVPVPNANEQSVSENQGSENNDIQRSKTYSVFPSTATYNSPGTFNIPVERSTVSACIPQNNIFDNLPTSVSYTSPSTSNVPIENTSIQALTYLSEQVRTISNPPLLPISDSSSSYNPLIQAITTATDTVTNISNIATDILAATDPSPSTSNIPVKETIRSLINIPDVSASFPSSSTSKSSASLDFSIQKTAVSTGIPQNSICDTPAGLSSSVTPKSNILEPITTPSSCSSENNNLMNAYFGASNVSNTPSNMDDLISGLVQIQTCTTSTTATSTSTSYVTPTEAETAVPTTSLPIGSIRVKSVWELT